MITSVSGSVSLICLSTASPLASGRAKSSSTRSAPSRCCATASRAGAGFERAVALLLQAIDERPANQRLVVDDEHGGVRHQVATPVARRRPSAAELERLAQDRQAPSAMARSRISRCRTPSSGRSRASGSSWRMVASNDRSSMSGNRRSSTMTSNACAGRRDGAQRRSGVMRLLNVETEPGQGFGDRPADQRLVIHHQHPAWDFSHDRTGNLPLRQRRIHQFTPGNRVRRRWWW